MIRFAKTSEKRRHAQDIQPIVDAEITSIVGIARPAAIRSSFLSAPISIAGAFLDGSFESVEVTTYNIAFPIGRAKTIEPPHAEMP